MHGERYIANSAAILAVLRHFEIPPADSCERMRHMHTPPGRMEFLQVEDQPTVVIDYAHTPDALEVALSSLAGMPKNQLWCVFGCGGDRDKGKRAMMARVAEKYADHIVVTSDNPRFEEPELIAEEIKQGFGSTERVQVDLDRANAIQTALSESVRGDIVLIAGKGDERTQDVLGCRLPFSDRAVVKNHLGVVE